MHMPAATLTAAQVKSSLSAEGFKEFAGILKQFKEVRSVGPGRALTDGSPRTRAQQWSGWSTRCAH